GSQVRSPAMGIGILHRNTRKPGTAGYPLPIIEGRGPARPRITPVAINDGRAALGKLHTLFHAGKIGDLTDSQLLERYSKGRGEDAELAFAAIVDRHGPLVHRVCCGILASPQDA